MHDTANTASPLSYSQSCDTFRPRRAVFRPARRTGLGRTAFVHFLERGPVRDRLIAELVPEGRPGCVVDALCHPGFGEFRSRHVADCDVIEASNEVERELVLEVSAGIGRLGMQLGYMPLVLSRPLRLRQLFGRSSPETVIGQLLSGGKRGEVFQSEIDSHTGSDRTRVHIGNLDHDVEEPVAAGVPREVGAVLDLAFGQRAAAEHTEGVAGKAERLAFAFKVAALQGHPAKRPSTAIAQEGPSVLAARLRVLLACRVHRAGMDAKFLAAAGGQHVQIEPCRPLFPPLERVLLRVVAEVPDVVHRSALLVQQTVKRFHPVAVDDDHAVDFTDGMPLSNNGAPFLLALKDEVSRSK